MQRVIGIVVLALFSATAGHVTAQDAADDNPADTATVITDTVSIDTAEALPAAPMDTVIYQRAVELEEYEPPTDTVNLERHLYQNPTTALFKSMFVPGWGQFGNHRYIKAALFAGVDAWMIISAVDNGSKAADFRDKFEAAQTTTERNAYYGEYEKYRDQRNKYTWYAVIVSFISMFDAYVDAHLSGFPERSRTEGLSFDVAPDLQTGGVQAAITVPF